MKNKIITRVFIFCIYITFCNYLKATETFQHCRLINNIDLILKEDFKSSATVVGIVFDVGILHEPKHKSGINYILADFLISKPFAVKLQKLGIVYHHKTSILQTEFIFTVPSKNLKVFFDIISEGITNFTIQNFEIYKEHRILEDKISDKHYLNTYKNNLLSNIYVDKNKPIKTLSIHAIESISEEDVYDFFYKYYRTCHISVFVVGAIGWRQLFKIVYPTIGTINDRKINNQQINLHSFIKSITIKSKYFHNTKSMVYILNHEEKNHLSSYLHFFMYELNKLFFANKLISYIEYKTINVGTNTILVIKYLPRSDADLTQIDKIFNCFIKKLIKNNYSKQYLTTAFEEINLRNKIANNNLFTLYENVKNAYIKHDGSKLEAANLTNENIYNLTKKIFFKNKLFDIITCEEIK